MCTHSPHSTGVSLGDNHSHQEAPPAPLKVCGACKCPQNLSTEQSPRGSATQVPLSGPTTLASPEPASWSMLGNTDPKTLTDRPHSAQSHLGNTYKFIQGQPPRHMPTQPCHQHVTTSVSTSPAPTHPPPAMKDPKGQGQRTTHDPSCSGKSLGPVSYGSLQEEPSGSSPSYRLCRERQGQAAVGSWHPRPTWLLCSCQVNRIFLVMLL